MASLSKENQLWTVWKVIQRQRCKPQCLYNLYRHFQMTTGSAIYMYGFRWKWKWQSGRFERKGVLITDILTFTSYSTRPTSAAIRIRSKSVGFLFSLKLVSRTFSCSMRTLGNWYDGVRWAWSCPLAMIGC